MLLHLMNQEKHLNLCFALQLLIGVVADKVSKNAIIIGIEYILYKKLNKLYVLGTRAS